MRAATGSQWSSMSSRVTCALFGWLNTRRAAAFWIICSGFTTQAGRHTHTHTYTHTRAHTHTHTPTHNRERHTPRHTSTSNKSIINHASRHLSTHGVK